MQLPVQLFCIFFFMGGGWSKAMGAAVAPLRQAAARQGACMLVSDGRGAAQSTNSPQCTSHMSAQGQAARAHLNTGASRALLEAGALLLTVLQRCMATAAVLVAAAIVWRRIRRWRGGAKGSCEGA